MQISIGQNNKQRYNMSFGVKFTPQDFSRATENYFKIMKSDYDNPLNFIFSKEFSIANIIKATKNYDEFVKEQIGSGKNIHTWKDDNEFNLLEGLQYGLKNFENMTMKGIYKLIDLLANKNNITLPVIRGCFHNCAHCFLAAKAPIERLKFEDYQQLLTEMKIMSLRIGKPLNRKEKFAEFFYDSDGSEVYLTDKNGKVHEFPELASMLYKTLKTKVLFDTAGWNPKSEKAQARMERLVKFYTENPNKYSSQICAVNLSINPYESTYFTAIQQKNKGNIKNYEKLKNHYIDMVTNMIHTFSPILENQNVSFICRTFPNSFKSKELEGLKYDDMWNLRKEIIDTYKTKYHDEVKKYPYIIDVIKNKFTIQENVGRTGRNNFLKKYSNDPYEEYESRVLSKKELENIGYSHNLIIDMDGKVYFGTDYRLFGTDLKFDYDEPKTKSLCLPFYSEKIEFQK